MHRAKALSSQFWPSKMIAPILQVSSIYLMVISPILMSFSARVLTVKLWHKCLTSARSKDQCGCCNARKCAAARDILTMQPREPRWFRAMFLLHSNRKWTDTILRLDLMFRYFFYITSVNSLVWRNFRGGCLWCYDPKYDWTTWPCFYVKSLGSQKWQDIWWYMIHDTKWRGFCHMS